MCAAARRKRQKPDAASVAPAGAPAELLDPELEKQIESVIDVDAAGVRPLRHGAEQHGATTTPQPDAPQHETVNTPHWDAFARELWFRGLLVTRFDRGAPDQELILASFEELNWMTRIPDPLSPRHGSDHRHRLRSAIFKLNQRQQTALLRFRGDGTGKGVCWQPVSEN